jgi:hypothetical protein
MWKNIPRSIRIITKVVLSYFAYELNSKTRYCRRNKREEKMKKQV